MGSKGPLVILGIGVLAMASMGFMANFMMSNSPALQHISSYRETVTKDYGAERVTLKETPQEFELRFWMTDFPGDPSTQELPETFTSLSGHWYRGFFDRHQRLRPKPLRVSFMRPQTWACQGGEESFLSVTIDFQEQLTLLKTQLAEVLGAGISTISVDPKKKRRLQIVVFGKKSGIDKIHKAGGILTAFLGGGWEGFDLQFSRKKVRLDGAGKIFRR